MTRSSGSRRRQWRAAKFAKDSKCHWCRCEMVLINTKGKSGGFPDNMATVDHLYTRYHPERQSKPVDGDRRLVLACNRCNRERDMAETAAQPREVLHARAGGHGDGAGMDWSGIQRGKSTPILWPPQVRA